MMGRGSGWAFIDLAWEGRGYCSVYTMSFILVLDGLINHTDLHLVNPPAPVKNI